MTKLERLLNLIAALLHSPLPLSAENLHTKLGEGAYPDDKVAFRRAFERDKDLLRTLGIPLGVAPIPYTDPPEDGYVIDEAEYAAKRHLDPEELAALRLAAGLIRLDISAPGVAVIGAAGDTDTEAVGRVGYAAANDVLIPAAANREAVSFVYNDEDRVVEPWVVGFSRGLWYFVGWDRLRSAKRTFRLDRIEGDVKPAGDASEPVGELHEPFAFRPWQWPEGPPVTVRIAVDADRAPMARSQFFLGEGELDAAADGRAVITLEVRSPARLRYALLDLGDSAEIIEPQELRDDMIAWLEALL